jgi:hypothetical protein
MKYYTIYKTTNLINNKIYIGLHTTDDINDGYLGSGVFLKKAIKKYGHQNFKKEILHVFDNKKDMINKEKEIVNEEFILRKDTYNMSKGGYGLSTLSTEKRKIAIEKMKITKQSQDLKIISDKRLVTMLNNDPDCFKKIAAKSSKKQKENYSNGYINPKQRLDDVLIYNENDILIYRIKRIDLSEFCSINDLPERVLINSIQNKGLPIYTKQAPRKEAYLKYKGWYALYENDKLD